MQSEGFSYWSRKPVKKDRIDATLFFRVNMCIVNNIFQSYEFWCQKHFQMSSENEVGEETFRGVESKS